MKGIVGAARRFRRGVGRGEDVLIFCVGPREA